MEGPVESNRVRTKETSFSLLLPRSPARRGPGGGDEQLKICWEQIPTVPPYD